MLVLQYCQHLHKHAVYLEPVKQSFKSFIDSIADDSIILLVCFFIIIFQCFDTVGWMTGRASGL